MSAPAQAIPPNPLREEGSFRPPEPAAIVIFGVSGDLASRKLLPALFRLHRAGRLGSGSGIVGVARREVGTEGFVKVAREALEGSSDVGTVDEGDWSSFAASLRYVQGDFAEGATYDSLAREIADLGIANRLYYLSTPPSAFVPIVSGLGRVGLAKEGEGWARLVVEKPFGVDLQSARELNVTVHASFAESQVYRIDHFLGKETVQNLLAIRFANGIFEPVLNRAYVDHVQITAAEDLGMEGRGAFYEEAGVLRDMIQNHLMQLLTLTAMEPPAFRRNGNGGSPDADALRDEKVRVIRALRPVSEEGTEEMMVLGQYGAGSLYGETVAGYRDEERVAKDSRTPTYAAVKVLVDNWRWAGVPFFLRSGKRLPKKSTEIAIVFKRPPLRLFGSDIEPNVLAVNIQPDEGAVLRFNAKVPGLGMNLRAVNMDFSYASFGQDAPTAYERLLLDALLGDPSLFPREDEVEAAWAWMESVFAAQLEPRPYRAGSWGPVEADALLGPSSDGGIRRWRRL